MTANEVAYWQLQESKRHNLKTESQGDIDVDTRKRVGDADIYLKGKDAKLKEAQEAKTYANIVTDSVTAGAKLISSLTPGISAAKAGFTI